MTKWLAAAKTAGLLAVMATLSLLPSPIVKPSLPNAAANKNASPFAPLVSVIVPTNRIAPRTLRNAIDSALDQTYPNVEVIVTDTTDDAEVANDLRSAYGSNPRVVLIRHGKQPLGTYAGYARNVAARAANGEYLAFLDADDAFVADKLEVQLQFMKLYGYLDFSSTEMFGSMRCRWKEGSVGDEGPAFVPWDTANATGAGNGHFRLYNGDLLDDTYREIFGGNNSQSLVRGSILPSFFDLDWLEMHNILCTSTVILRKSVFDHVGGFTETLRRAEDHDLWLRILRETEVDKVGYFPKPLTIYDLACHGRESDKRLGNDGKESAAKTPGTKRPEKIRVSVSTAAITSATILKTSSATVTGTNP